MIITTGEVFRDKRTGKTYLNEGLWIDSHGQIRIGFDTGNGKMNIFLPEFYEFFEFVERTHYSILHKF